MGSILTQVCWCGSTDLSSFNDAYYLCQGCGTLAAKVQPAEDLTDVRDRGEIYSRDYYLSHLPNDYGLPDLPTRTRDDLPERNVHWLRTLLKYRLPPANVLEIGCAHGGFVALMQWAGFNAAGLELSPWLVDYARRTFGVQVQQGPLERQQLAAASLDVIVLMDVLEHLSHPARTMALALSLLRPEGLILIQTPCYPEGVSHAELMERKAHFLDMLLSREHLYLFSRSSARELFDRLGAAHVTFVPSMYDYDMSFLVSRQALEVIPEDRRRSTLEASPSGRMVQALLQLFDRAEMLQSAADERMDVIQRLKAAADERLRVIAELKAAADERLRLLQQMSSRGKGE